MLLKPHWGALGEPFMKMSTRFALTSRAMKSLTDSVLPPLCCCCGRGGGGGGGGERAPSLPTGTPQRTKQQPRFCARRTGLKSECVSSSAKKAALPAREGDGRRSHHTRAACLLVAVTSSPSQLQSRLQRAAGPAAAPPEARGACPRAWRPGRGGERRSGASEAHRSHSLKVLYIRTLGANPSQQPS